MPKDKLFENCPSVGLVIGACAGVPHIHLHLETWRLLYPDIPVLVHDDHSPQHVELARLCAHYGADFIKTPARLGHQAGDLSAYVAGLKWAKAQNLTLLVKMSQRFLPLINWVPDLQSLALESQFATYSNECTGHRHAFRSECAALHVDTWSSVVNVLQQGVESQGFGIVENFLHHLSSDLHRARCNANREFEDRCAQKSVKCYGLWLPFLGNNGKVPQKSHLWHRANSHHFYHARGVQYGLAYHPPEYEDTLAVTYKPKNENASPPGSLTERLYESACASPSDISEHLLVLSTLSGACDHVTELTSRIGNSTIALLHGRPKKICVHDINTDEFDGGLKAAANESGIDFHFFSGDVLSTEIEPTDLLFIDSIHTYGHIKNELNRHARKAAKFLVFHDTQTFRDRGENNEVGIWPAIKEYVRDNPQWSQLVHYNKNHGLTVLCKDPQARRIMKDLPPGDPSELSVCGETELSSNGSPAIPKVVVELYNSVRKNRSDINEHIELLSRLASVCDSVTEFGVRGGNSTIGFLYGRPRKLRSYDINVCPRLEQLNEIAGLLNVDFGFTQADTRSVVIDDTDLLFIDTLHTFDQVTAELKLHAGKVARYIVLHDTTTFGDRGFNDETGIWPAVAAFLRANRQWEIAHYFTNNNGLTVLRNTGSTVNEHH